MKSEIMNTPKAMGNEESDADYWIILQKSQFEFEKVKVLHRLLNYKDAFTVLTKCTNSTREIWIKIYMIITPAEASNDSDTSKKVKFC